MKFAGVRAETDLRHVSAPAMERGYGRIHQFAQFVLDGARRAFADAGEVVFD
ncbi:MAG: hypothetical protein HYR56_19465 [Acidobacteria bacterium]|nr:hypothetical protein [Acidobacteriota bacterium]MBI3424171.1 hypothetical protein [Acidobacteriota bacterium]